MASTLDRSITADAPLNGNNDVMLQTPLTVCVVGDTYLDDQVTHALSNHVARAMVVPRVRLPSGAIRSGRGPTLGPFALTWIARGHHQRNGEFPFAPVVAVPHDLLAAVGGPDPRFATAIGWADLLERLRHLEPNLPIIDAEDVTDHREMDPTALATDAHLHAANRTSIAWRIAARLVRPSDPTDPPSPQRQLRRFSPGS